MIDQDQIIDRPSVGDNQPHPSESQALKVLHLTV